jgi:hypothetical protein
MRYRWVFIIGVGVGFVLGARAGRERYEQLAKLTRKAKDSPAVQQAAGAVQAQAASLVKTTKGKLADRVPKLTETARSKAGTARSKVEATLHDHGAGAKNNDGRPAPDGSRGRYTSAPDSPGGAPS